MRQSFVPRRWASGAVLALAATAIPLVASAHPMGNFSISRFNGLVATSEQVRLDRVVDMGEIPTFTERRAMDTDRDGEVSDDEATAWAAVTCAQAADPLVVQQDGEELEARSSASTIAFPARSGLADAAPGMLVRVPAPARPRHRRQRVRLRRRKLPRSHRLARGRRRGRWRRHRRFRRAGRHRQRSTPALSDRPARRSLRCDDRHLAGAGRPERRRCGDGRGADRPASRDRAIRRGRPGYPGRRPPVGPQPRRRRPGARARDRRGARDPPCALTRPREDDHGRVPPGVTRHGAHSGRPRSRRRLLAHGRRPGARAAHARRFEPRAGGAPVPGPRIRLGRHRHRVGCVAALAALRRLARLAGHGAGARPCRWPRPRPRARARPCSRARARARHAHEHGSAHTHDHGAAEAHDHGHDHADHHDHDHDHAGEQGQAVEHGHGPFRHRHEVPTQRTGWRGLAALGLAGGMVPSVSALILVLGASVGGTAESSGSC